MIWSPRTTVAAVIEKNGSFLMVEECPEGSGPVINQPAGHLEEGESLQDACRRGVLEETCWSIEPQALLGVYKWIVPERGLTYIRYCFTGKPVVYHGEREPDKEILRAVWLTAEEIEAKAEHHRSPMVQLCLNDYLTGNRYPLELINEIVTA